MESPTRLREALKNILSMKDDYKLWTQTLVFVQNSVLRYENSNIARTMTSRNQIWLRR